MKNIFILAFYLTTFLSFSQCPIPSNSFVGNYNVTQVTPIHPELGVHAFNDIQVILSLGQNDNERVFSAVYAKDLNFNQSPMDISFTLDCQNGNQVVVDSNLNTFLTCGSTPGITLGPDNSTGTFNQSDDNSFNLILQEFVDDGGCDVPTPLVTEFTLTKSNCLIPENIAVFNVTGTTAEVSWSDFNNTTPIFTIEYGPEDFELGSGTIISGINTTSTQITGLQNGNSYDLYIKTNCVSEDTPYIGPITFPISTVCSDEYSNYPIFEDFDNAFFLNQCYNTIDEDGNSNDWGQQTLQVSSGVFLNFAVNGSNTSQKEDYLFSPGFYMESGNNYNISVKYNAIDFNGSAANENLEVVVSRGTTVNDFNLGTLLISDFGISQNGSLDQIENMATLNNVQFSPNTSGYYHLAFKSSGSPLPSNSTTGFLVIFDFTIDETLSVDEFQNLGFNYFIHNGHALNMSANQPLNQVKIYNLMGQELLSKKLFNQKEVINLTDLTTGVYIAKVLINDKIKTFKILKK